MNKQTWIIFKIIFTDEYHNLKLNQKLISVHTVYHSVKYVVLTGYIYSALNNPALVATSYQSHSDQITTETRQMTETNRVLGYQTKQLAYTKSILERQGKTRKTTE